MFQSLKTICAFINEYHAGLLRGTLTFLDNTLVYLYDKKPSIEFLCYFWNYVRGSVSRCIL